MAVIFATSMSKTSVRVRKSQRVSFILFADGLNVAFESVMSPGNHVGILPDGTIKLPNQTGTGQHAKFTPSVYYRVRIRSLFI